MLIPLIALLSHSQVPSAVPTELVNGRPISWDEFGLVPLDAFHPATSFSKRCLELVAKFDYGTLETICKERLESADDPVAGWYLAKLAPIRHEEPAMLEFAWKKWQSTKKNGWMVTVENLDYSAVYSKGFTIRKEDYSKWLPIMQATEDSVFTQCPELKFQGLRHAHQIQDLEAFQKMYKQLADAYPKILALRVFEAWSHRALFALIPVMTPNGKSDDKERIEGGDYDTAEKMMQQFITAHPDFGPAYCFLGQSLVLHKRLKQAKPVMEQALTKSGIPPRLRAWPEAVLAGRKAPVYRD